MEDAYEAALRQGLLVRLPSQALLVPMPVPVLRRLALLLFLVELPFLALPLLEEVHQNHLEKPQ
jgi:hypothetical protein